MSAVDAGKLKSVQDKIRSLVPSRFKMVITHPCLKTVRVSIDLGDHSQQHAMKKTMKGRKLHGVCLQKTGQGMKLVVAGTHAEIIARVQACKKHILTAA